VTDDLVEVVVLALFHDQPPRRFPKNLRTRVSLARASLARASLARRRCASTAAGACRCPRPPKNRPGHRGPIPPTPPPRRFP
jgi:hypothetical protein